MKIASVVILERELEEAVIRRVLAEEAVAGDLPTERAGGSVGRSTPRGSVEEVEDSRELRAMVTGSGSRAGISQLLRQRKEYDSADLWFIDAEARLSTALTGEDRAASTCLSDGVLRSFREEFLAELNTIPKDMTEADRTIQRLRQSNWSRWWPAGDGDQERLRNFVVNLFLSGNGALIFSNAFVEWAAAEAMRRARPRALVACFGMRSKPKPFTGIAIFENQQKTSPLPDVDDPDNSAVDAAILAHYIWLAAGRYSEYGQALCLCVSEELNSAYVVAPPEKMPQTGNEPVPVQEIYRWIAEWISGASSACGGSERKAEREDAVKSV